MPEYLADFVVTYHYVDMFRAENQEEAERAADGKIGLLTRNLSTADTPVTVDVNEVHVVGK